MYWILKIIFTAIFSLCAFTSSEANSICKSENINPDIRTFIMDIDENYTNESLEEYSTFKHAIRTINHIINSKHTDASAAVCLLNSFNKDNNDYKFLLPVITVLYLSKDLIQNITGYIFNINSHPIIIHSKNYYLYSLEKILI